MKIGVYVEGLMEEYVLNMDDVISFFVWVCGEVCSRGLCCGVGW